jgi:Predicted membrane protein (DUF2142)
MNRDAAPHGDRLTPGLVFVSYALMMAAWVVGNPPYGAPDEWHHYVRAVSIGQGQLVGEPAGLEGAKAIVGGERPRFLSARVYDAQVRWVEQHTTRVRIPAGMTPGWFRCGALQQDPSIPARCLNGSPPVADAQDLFNPAGTYQPFPYLLPAALSRAIVDPDTLTRAMRSAKAIVALLFAGAAVVLLWDPHARLLSLVGLAAAMTPMAVFLSATLNPSGLEITSAIAFAAALIRLTRDPSDRRWTWILVATAGSVLALSRGQGPLWIVLDAALVLPLVGIGRLSAITIRDSKWSAPALIVIASAVILNRLWEHVYGPALAFDPFPLDVAIRAGLRQLPEVLRQQIGVFDYLEVDMPSFAYATWTVLTGSLLIFAFAFGTDRERLILTTGVAVTLALPIALVASTMRHTGFPLQGRYVLAISVIAPLLAGEILVRHHERLGVIGKRLIPLLIAAAALVQFVAWWANARRFAVGRNGPRWFLTAAEWSPPWGWWPWMILAASGASVLLLTVLRDQIRQSEFFHQRRLHQVMGRGQQ